MIARLFFRTFVAACRNHLPPDDERHVYIRHQNSPLAYRVLSVTETKRGIELEVEGSVMECHEA